MKPIAHIHTEFPDKFGIPRQSGLVEELRARIVFTPEYRNPDALRGLEGFSHIWLIWEFSRAKREDWSPTVRPPRLGGNTRMGVFATRSPFRPNPIGLSSVRLVDIALSSPEGPVITVAGADLMEGTPIFDIKPYLPYTDSHPEAVGGFAQFPDSLTHVDIPDTLSAKLPPDTLTALRSVLAQDPRPAYAREGERVYGFAFAGYEVSFTASDGKITVCDIKEN